MNDKQAIPWDKHDPPYSMIADQNRSVIQKKYIPHFQSASNGPRSQASAAWVAATSPPCAVTPSRTADTLVGTTIEQCHTQITSCGSRGAVSSTDRGGCPDGCWFPTNTQVVAKRGVDHGGHCNAPRFVVSLILVLVFIVDFGQAVFTPDNWTPLRDAVDACLNETADGSCPDFAALRCGAAPLHVQFKIEGSNRSS